LLFASVLGVSFFPGRSPRPRRVYDMSFEGIARERGGEVAMAEPEVLEDFESEASESALPELTADNWLEVASPVRRGLFKEPALEAVPTEEWSDHRMDRDLVGFESASAPPLRVKPPPPAKEPIPEPTEPDDEDVEDKLPPSHTPERIEGEDADYPRMSLRLEEAGDVELRLSLDEEGRVRGVELEESSGFARLDEAAMSAAPRWRFDLTPPPGFEADDVLRSFVHIVHFQLEQ
jgi:protein TonB